MAIYSLPLAAVLVAAALHNDRTTRTMNDLHSSRDKAGAGFQSPAQDRAGRQSLLTLEKQLARLRRRVRRLRVKFSLERGAVFAQLYDADAQLAHAQLTHNIACAELVRETVGLDFLDQQAPPPPTAMTEEMADEPLVIATALQHLEDQLTRKIKTLLRTDGHTSIRQTVVDLGASLETARLEIDALTTRHHEQLGALYDALVAKRLRLRALYALIQKLRVCKRDVSAVLPQEQYDVAHAIATQLRLTDQDEHDDDAPMAMLEVTNDSAGSDGDAEYDDGDGDDEDDDVAVQEASI